MWYNDFNNGCAEYVIRFFVIDLTGLSGLLYMCIEEK